MQALRTGGDTGKVDTAYDTLRDEDRRREYDGRHAGGGGGGAFARRDTGESYEVVERGSGEVKDWAPAGGQAASGDGDTAQLSLGKLAGLLNEAVTGGRLCASHACVATLLLHASAVSLASALKCFHNLSVVKSCNILCTHQLTCSCEICCNSSCGT